jgi:hypothetical protein
VKKERFNIGLKECSMYMNANDTLIKSEKYSMKFKTHLIKRLSIKLHDSIVQKINLGVVPVDVITFDYPYKRMSRVLSTDPYFIQMEIVRKQFYGKIMEDRNAESASDGNSSVGEVNLSSAINEGSGMAK